MSRDRDRRCACGPLGAAVLAGLLVAGCGDNERVPPGHKGDLENGTFSYRCADASDQFCDTTAFPTTIAMGSVFGVDYEYFEGVEKSTPSLVPAAGGVPTEGADLFRMEQLSPTAILCVIEDEEVVDFFHVAGEEVAALAIYETIDDDESGTVAIKLAPSESRSLRSSAVDAGATPLAGAFDYEWTIDDPAVASLEPDPAGSHRVTITAGGALGDQTTLQVAGAGLTLTVDVSIEEPGDTGGGDDGSTSGTTGATGQTTDGSGTTSTGGGATTTGGSATTSTGSTGTP
jgi:hypothetical protein